MSWMLKSSFVRVISLFSSPSTSTCKIQYHSLVYKIRKMFLFLKQYVNSYSLLYLSKGTLLLILFPFPIRLNFLAVGFFPRVNSLSESSSIIIRFEHEFWLFDTLFLDLCTYIFWRSHNNSSYLIYIEHEKYFQQNTSKKLFSLIFLETFFNTSCMFLWYHMWKYCLD